MTADAKWNSLSCSRSEREGGRTAVFRNGHEIRLNAQIVTKTNAATAVA